MHQRRSPIISTCPDWVYTAYPGIFIALIVSVFSCTSSGGNKPVASRNVDTATINSLIEKASSFVQTNYDSMHVLADSALQLSRMVNYREGIAKTKAVESDYQRRKGNYISAVAISLEVIGAYDSLGLWADLVRVQNRLADTYKEMGGEKGVVELLEKGLELSRKAQKIAEEKNNQPGVVLSLNQQGIILRDLSEIAKRRDLLDTAFVLYKKAVDIVEQTGQGIETLGKLYNNISQVYNEQYADYPMALQYAMKAVEYNTGRRNLNSLTFNYNNVSDIYMRMGNYPKAKEYAHRMLDICTALKAPHRTVNAYEQLARISKKMNQFDSALYYRESNMWVADSLANVKKTAQIADMQTKYETQKKESQITQLTDSNKAKSQGLWVIAIAALLLATLAGIFVWQNKRLQMQKKQIAAQSERLEWMMKELHHRVKNNLQIVSSLLNLQTYRLKDDESISAIRESQLRVQAMSLIHQRLYQVQDVSMVNFKLYIDDLVVTLMQAYGYGPDSFDLKINIEEELLDVDTVMPMGLLVNEVITNSFKYAFKTISRPALTVSLTKGQGDLQLSISDNGPGMDTSATSKAGFGKKLISALTKQLKATYSLSVSDGTSYLFTIPYSKDKAA
jgi:two-component sensor histidine kinase/tetratricopeptide (TPR) repeat protein